MPAKKETMPPTRSRILVSGRRREHTVAVSAAMYAPIGKSQSTWVAVTSLASCTPVTEICRAEMKGILKKTSNTTPPEIAATRRLGDRVFAVGEAFGGGASGADQDGGAGVGAG